MKINAHNRLRNPLTAGPKDEEKMVKFLTKYARALGTQVQKTRMGNGYYIKTNDFRSGRRGVFLSIQSVGDEGYEGSIEIFVGPYEVQTSSVKKTVDLLLRDLVMRTDVFFSRTANQVQEMRSEILKLEESIKEREESLKYLEVFVP